MKRYAVIIAKTATGYAAHAPDVPGCIATGRTLEKVRHRFAEALVVHMEGMREDGLPIPEPTSLCEYVEVATPAARTV
jgi:predicted RNase H-like HicB family nuclease